MKSKMKNIKSMSKDDLLYYLIAASAAILIGWVFYDDLIFMVLLIFVIVPLKKFYNKYLEDKKSKELNTQFKDLLYSLNSSFLSGRDMRRALIEGEKAVIQIHKKNSILALDLKNINRKLGEEFGQEETVLSNFAHNTKNDDIISFFDSYFTIKISGGDLSKVVTKTVKVLIEKMEIEQDIKTGATKKLFEGRLLTVIPVGLLLVLKISNTGYLNILYETVEGKIVMSICLLIIVLSFLLTNKIMDIKI